MRSCSARRQSILAAMDKSSRIAQADFALQVVLAADISDFARSLLDEHTLSNDRPRPRPVAVRRRLPPELNRTRTSRPSAVGSTSSRDAVGRPSTSHTSICRFGITPLRRSCSPAPRRWFTTTRCGLFIDRMIDDGERPPPSRLGPARDVPLAIYVRDLSTSRQNQTEVFS